MRFTFALLAALSLSGLAVSAHATTLYPIVAGQYNISATAADGYALTGTITFGSNSNITGASLTFQDNNGDPLDTTYPTFNSVSNAGYQGNGVDYVSITGPNGDGEVQLDIPLNGTTNSNGTPIICSASTSCGAQSIGYDPSQVAIYTFIDPHTGRSFNTSGSSLLYGITLSVPPPAATPEPSSLMLLGTGILGLAGAAKRRIRKA